MKIYSILKIKKGKKKVWENWCFELMGKHYKEGLESIQEENLIRERCIIIGDYVFYEHVSLKGKKKPWNPSRKLNHKHNKKHGECLEYLGRIEVKDGEKPFGYDYALTKN